MGGKRNPQEAGEITRLLQAWQEGSEEAQTRLWSTVYGDLKQMARSSLRRGGRASRADATSLVHKAYLRLLDSDVAWEDRRHFFAVAARSMRFILADEARRQLSLKRGGGAVLNQQTGFPEMVEEQAYRPEEVLAVHELLDRLAAVRPRHEKLVELRYFAGFSVEETAAVLGVTPRTVVRDWRAIRIWAHDKLQVPD